MIVGTIPRHRLQLHLPLLLELLLRRHLLHVQLTLLFLLESRLDRVHNASLRFIQLRRRFQIILGQLSLALTTLHNLIVLYIVVFGHVRCIIGFLVCLRGWRIITRCKFSAEAMGHMLLQLLSLIQRALLVHLRVSL